jgi:hypothetical protein
MHNNSTEKKERFLSYSKTLFLLLFLTIHFIISGHGFGYKVLVRLPSGKHKEIYSLCLDAVRSSIDVATCNIENSSFTHQRINAGKKSNTNCFIKLSFDSTFRDDIICTPDQEFYLPQYRQWLPAYMLNPGDRLLTANLTLQNITYKEFIPKPLKICMLEIEQTHTFFVSKYSILTHNIFLPITACLDIAVPFGGLMAGTIGSFFGTPAITIGFAVGSLAGIAIKTLYEKHIHHYKEIKYHIPSLMSYYQNDFIAIEELHSTKQNGCFEEPIIPENLSIFPIEYPYKDIVQGCISIYETRKEKSHIYHFDKTIEQKKINNKGCFQNQEYPLQTTTSVPQKLTARTWGEFESNCPIGQQYGKKFMHTGKQNPKDNSPIRKLTEDIPNTEMFKQGYYFAPDRFHDGDHFEVWNKKGDWIGVANLDGSKNHKKSNATTDKNQRHLPR